MLFLVRHIEPARQVVRHVPGGRVAGKELLDGERARAKRDLRRLSNDGIEELIRSRIFFPVGSWRRCPLAVSGRVDDGPMVLSGLRWDRRGWTGRGSSKGWEAFPLSRKGRRAAPTGRKARKRSDRASTVEKTPCVNPPVVKRQPRWVVGRSGRGEPFRAWPGRNGSRLASSARARAPRLGRGFERHGGGRIRGRGRRGRRRLPRGGRAWSCRPRW